MFVEFPSWNSTNNFSDCDDFSGWVNFFSQNPNDAITFRRERSRCIGRIGHDGSVNSTSPNRLNMARIKVWKLFFLPESSHFEIRNAFCQGFTNGRLPNE